MIERRRPYAPHVPGGVRFAHTIIYVRDVPQTLGFYRDAFGLETSFLHPGQQYGELYTGPTKLSFASHSLAEENVPCGFRRADEAGAKPLGIEIALMTDDVPAVVERAVAAGAELLAAPVAKPWGQTVAYLRDPDGTLIEICTPVRAT